MARFRDVGSWVVGARDRLKSSASALLFALLAYSLMAPFNPLMPRDGLDPSWIEVMVQGLDSGLKFGKQLIFTFGPLSFLYTNTYAPHIFIWNCILMALGALAYGWLLDRRIRQAFQSRVLRLVLSLCLTLAFTQFDDFWYSLPILGAFELVGPMEREQPARGAQVLVWVALGVLTLVKASFGSIAALLYGVAVFKSAVRRSFSRTLAAYPLALLACWLLTGQRLSTLFDYAKNSLFIATGYGVAMSQKPPSTWPYLLFAATMVVALVLLAVTIHKQAGVLVCVVDTLALTGLAWLLFKTTVTRNYATTSAILVLGFVSVAMLFCRAWQRRGWIAWAALPALALAILTAKSTIELIAEEPFLGFLRKCLVGSWETLGDELAAVREWNYRERYDASHARIRARHRFKPLPGTYDVYRVNQAMVFAYDLPWSPRPVFQSYSAYKPQLIDLNLAHLRGSRAPDNVLLELTTTDRKFPALEDGASLIELISRYDVVSIGNDLAQFKKRAQPNPYRLLNTQHFVVKEGEWLELSFAHDRKLVATIDFGQTLAGKLSAMFYRSPVVEIELGFQRGKDRRYRIAPGLTERGFLLSPLVTTPAEWALLNDVSGAPPPPNVRVTRLRLNIESGYEFSWKSLDIGVSELEFASEDHTPLSDAERERWAQRAWSPERRRELP